MIATIDTGVPVGVFAPGRYPGLSNDAYHSDTSAVSSTKLKAASRSAAHLQAELFGEKEPSTSRALLLGNAIHTAVLEPDLFENLYVVAPSADDLAHFMPSRADELLVIARQIRESLIADLKKSNPDAIEDCSSKNLTALCRAKKIKGFSAWTTNDQLKAGLSAALVELGEAAPVFLDDLIAESPAAAFATVNKATKDELKDMIRLVDPEVVFADEAALSAVEGKTELSSDEWAMCLSIRDAVLSHPKASKLLSGGVAEESVFYVHQPTGKLAKVRADYYREDLGVIVDLKSCEDARPDAAMRSIYKFGYHLSAAMYLDGFRSVGLPAHTFVWIFVEKSAPFGIRIYVASPSLLEAGDREYHSAMDVYAHGLDTGEWPGYVSEIESIDLPRWA